MSLVVPAEAGTQSGLAWIPAFAGKTRVILLEALRHYIYPPPCQRLTSNEWLMCDVSVLCQLKGTIVMNMASH